MKIKPYLKDYFYFTKTERLGIAVLTSVLFLLLLSPSIYRFVSKTPAIQDDSPIQLDSIIVAEPQYEIENNLFFFDPNTATETELINLGIPNKTVSSILNYRQKGGVFRKKEDFSRIYTLKKTDYERLLPWIHFPPVIAQHNTETKPINTPVDVTVTPFDPNTTTAEHLSAIGLPVKTVKGWINYLAKGGKFRRPEDVKKLYTLSERDYQRIVPNLLFPSINSKSKSTATVQPIEINSATIQQWASLPGIGNGWATRIIRFKEKLGGFAQIAQVAETYGLPDSVFQKITPFLQLNTGSLTYIHLNQASYDQLNQHPYIDSKQASWIIAYRKQHGTFKSAEELLQIPTLKSDWFEKIKPYFTL